MKQLSLKHFIVRAQVIALYRDIMRTLIRIDDVDYRKESQWSRWLVRTKWIFAFFSETLDTTGISSFSNVDRSRRNSNASRSRTTTFKWIEIIHADGFLILCLIFFSVCILDGYRRKKRIVNTCSFDNNNNNNSITSSSKWCHLLSNRLSIDFLP